MTEYQKAVAEHMADAPEELRDYVCERLVESHKWMGGRNPIRICGFAWRDSKEGYYFWVGIYYKDWQEAMDTDFWQSRQQPTEQVTEQPEEYDFVNPKHYQEFSVEVIDMMAAIWGKEATATHCEMCAFKYKLRAGSKPDQPIDRDLEKAAWYLSKAKELRDA